MKNQRLLYIIFLLVFFNTIAQESNRIQTIKNNLELLAMENSELNERLKLEINVNNVTLPSFLVAVSKVHNLNLTVAPDIGNISIVNNFSDVTVADLFVFLCKEYELDIEFTGNILSIKKYTPPIIEIKDKEIHIDYDHNSKLISLDLKNDPLEKVFRQIMDSTGENLLFSNNMESIPLNLYMINVPFEKAMENLADMNNLSYSKSRDGFYLFSSLINLKNEDYHKNQLDGNFGRPNLNYEVLDTINKILNVDFINAPIASIIKELSYDLKLDVYTATSLEHAGFVTFNAKNILFDDMLNHIFESQEKSGNQISSNPSGNQNIRQNNQNQISPEIPIPNFTFKKENEIYFFGTTDQLSLRNVEIVQMMHRSVELLSDPKQQSNGSSMSNRFNNFNSTYYGNNTNNGFSSNQSNSNLRSLNTQSQEFDIYQDNAEAIVSIIPDEIKSGLEIKVDYELNSFFVSGPSTKINGFKKFINEIDKPVPVVLIEVMIIEVKKSATVETGISWGIGDATVTTQGKIFPETDITLGAKTINKIIGGFDGFGSFNIGQVVPDFFASIKAMEENGNLKIRSTPKLSTLNGHRAKLSIGETTYYVVTNQNYFGSQIPTTSEVRNYQPIDAELAISIKPLVSGNGQVTLDINVVQSDFSGERIENDAPPGLTSREFSSIIRMQNQDLAILGGLEEKIKNDSGNGVPFLARIPVIKWLFSQRKREDSKQKLTILIKPTVIY
ncbi:type II and III secretion system protein [Maribacter polysiphoniae]|uniref:Type II and III secretion system protein n=1 Tax=Maribacter polysiphoniae TaxID=429344 RepID=A0A316EI41_9FLAO|nr:type II and III secretion system protein [Maribacter polysiphoniae]MBD1261612.1 type II and III secretion system protein [Maribacter polysiphoniae]PWK22590.1 type IV pilus assembly protein PilQ [Maribacter polysiphoniae]